MICTTLANGESALDLTWYKDNPSAAPTLKQVYTFKKERQYVTGVSDYTDVLLKYTTYYGYVVRKNEENGSVIVSKTGHADVFDLWVHKDWVMLIYRKAEGDGDYSKVFIVDKAQMKIPFARLTPTAYLASPMAKLLGSPSTSYCCVGGNLFEIFGCANVGLLDADYQIYAGMSLVAAFNVRAGSLGLRYWPRNNRAALGHFFNKSLAEKTFVDLPNGWGVYFTSQKRASASSLISNIQNGIKLTDTSWCKVYPTPTTKARTTSAIPSFVCKFAGSKPVKPQADCSVLDVVYTSIIFANEPQGEGIREWVNGADEWKVATYYLSTDAELASIVAQYNDYMVKLFAAAAENAVKSINASIDTVNKMIVDNAHIGSVSTVETRPQFKAGVSSKIAKSQFSQDETIGRLTQNVLFQYTIPVRELFPEITGRVSGTLAQLTNNIAQNTPQLLKYLQLCCIKATKGDKVSYLDYDVFAKDTTSYDKVEIGVRADAEATFQATICGSGSDSLTSKINALLHDTIGEALIRNTQTAPNVNVVPQSNDDEDGDDTMVSFGYRYGCKHRFRKTADGYWCASESVGKIEWDTTKITEDKNIFKYFPVNHAGVGKGTEYYKRLKAAGYDDTSIYANRAGKAFDFEIERICVNGFKINPDGTVASGTTVEVVVDDFELEQTARSIDQTQFILAIRRRWANSFNATSEDSVSFIGNGKYCLDSHSAKVSTGSCFWNYSHFDRIPINGRHYEVVMPSRRLRIVLPGSILNGVVGNTASKFLLSTSVLDKPILKIVSDLNAMGLCYLLKRLAAYGDLKNCKMLVNSGLVYMWPHLAKYFTALTLNEAGAKAIQDAVNALISAREYQSDGSLSGTATIKDEATIAALREVANDMSSLALKADENQPWYAASTDIKVTAGVLNLDALGIYLYL
jgi:hypothetical protein